MNLIYKLLIFFVVAISIYIVWSLSEDTKIMKKQVSKTIESNQKITKEGFETTETPSSSKSLDKKYHEFPLRELMIKSSYNSCINDAGISKDALKETILKCYRCIDFELYTRTDKNDNPVVYVSYSKDPHKDLLETDLIITFKDACKVIAENAFSGATQCSYDPLFINLRVMNATPKTYEIISDNLNDVLGDHLIKTEVVSTTPYSDIKGKAIIIMDHTHSPKCHTNEKCKNIVNIFSGTMQCPLYNYNDYVSMTHKKVTVNLETMRTDIGTFSMVTPAKMTTSVPKIHAPVQFFFVHKSDKYDQLFNELGYSVCPMYYAVNYLTNI